jgi:hypothetical protein
MVIGGFVVYFIKIATEFLFEKFILPSYKYKDLDHMVYALRALTLGIIMLGLTAGICLLYHTDLFFSWYVVAGILIIFGIWGIWPTEISIKGIKLDDDTYMRLHGPYHVTVTHKNKEMAIEADRTRERKKVYIENKSTDEDYQHVIKLVAKNFEEDGYQVSFNR